MKKKLRLFQLILTMAFSLLGCLICEFVGTRIPLSDSIGGKVLINGMTLMLVLFLGWLGMRLAILLDSRNYQIRGADVHPVLLVVTLVASLLLGMIGELVYALEIHTETEQIEVEGPAVESMNNHIFMLMDQSGSMSGKTAACVEAACNLIDGLSEEDTMQYGCFAYYMQDYNISPYLKLNTANKEELKQFIRTHTTSGGTSFDGPLTTAAAALTQHAEDGYRNVVLMLTDGLAKVSDSVISLYQQPDVNIDLYVVRLTDGTLPDSSGQMMIQKLESFAADIIEIQQEPDGGVDVSEVLMAFQSAVEPDKEIQIIEHKKLGFGDAMLVFNGKEKTGFVWQFFIPLIVFALYSVLVSLAYYGRLQIGGVFYAAVTGIIVGLSKSVMGWVLIPLVLLILTSVTFYQVVEVQFDV